MEQQERKTIGVCGSRIFNQIPMSFINLLRKESIEYDYYTIAFSSNTDMEEDFRTDVDDKDRDVSGESQLFDLVKYIDFSGLVILTETIKNPSLICRIVEIGKSKNIPVFSVDGTVKGCYNMVMDYHDGFEQIVRHVVEDHGCRKVDMIAGFKGHPLSEERIQVYKKILQENGIPFEEGRLWYGDFWDRPTRAVMKEILEDGKGLPEAIVCANDAMAITVCSELNSKGIRVPEDIIVTGFDGTKDGKYHFPILSTCEPDYEGAIKFIIKEMEKKQETGNIVPCDYRIGFKLSGRQSCGCESMVMHDINTIVSSFGRDLGDCSWHNIAMNNMVSSVLEKKSVMDIAVKIPEYINLWSDNFRFACLNSDVVKYNREADRDNAEMVTVLWDYRGEFREPGETFDVSEFVPHLDEVIRKGGDIDTLIVRLLNSGRKVYGYTVEGFQDLDDRRLQRSNEFAMFLSFSIDTVLHNYQLAKLNEDLSEAYNKIAKLYILDPMTGIYNRRGFFQKFDEMIGEKANIGKYLYLFSIDMDGLKHINDTYGHGEGDFAIISLSKAITRVLGDSAVCSRFGGDEFTCAVILGQKEHYTAEGLSKELAVVLGQTEGIQEKPYSVSASIGLICEEITEDIDIESMLSIADKRMYSDKVARKKERRE
ncbi:GGDEF domain-containing protein [bacterium D16-51]|nr:GGDEF domain-containing protein [bacterium D16-59]RKI55339.1 GGDEF domain-containing protein [bacterium D16-51]